MIEPIMVYRSFAFRDGVLTGMHGAKWGSARLVASCEHGREHSEERCVTHLRQRECTCGIYGTYLPESLYGADAIARCVAFGIVWPWSHGVRTSQMEIVELFLIKGDESRAQQLRERYNVPVSLLFPELPHVHVDRYENVTLRTPNKRDYKRRGMRPNNNPTKILKLLSEQWTVQRSTLVQLGLIHDADCTLNRMRGALPAYPAPLIKRVARGEYIITEYGLEVLCNGGKLNAVECPRCHKPNLTTCHLDEDSWTCRECHW